MFVGPVSLAAVVAFLNGYDRAAHREGRPGWGGWRDWLMANHQVSPNLVGEAQIRQIALPDAGDRRNLAPEQEAQVLAGLFERLDTFLAEQEGATSG